LSKGPISRAFREIDPMYALRESGQCSPPGNDSAPWRPGGAAPTCTIESSNLDSGQRRARGPADIACEPDGEERFVEEITELRGFLARNAARLTDQRADAEDLVQETLLKAYLYYESYSEGTQFKSWIARIMTNAWIDRHRRTERRPKEKLSAELSDTPTSLHASRANHSSGVESAETRVLEALPSDAELALSTLPDDLREIVYYACIAEYRYADIAAVLDIPIGTVASRLHRGKKMLREALVSADGGPES
jgi:RNA polymerase sigma-70 factor, ECF subfamily